MSSSSGRSRDVVEGILPLLGRLGQRNFVDVLGVGADRVAARAEPAVDRADVERQEERLIDVAMDESGHRRVFLLVQRVERQARMIGQRRRGKRNELAADRIADRVVPIDQARSRTARRARPSALGEIRLRRRDRTPASRPRESSRAALRRSLPTGVAARGDRGTSLRRRRA